MIGVDTNVLIRLFVTDEQNQHRRAVTFFAARTPDEPAFLSLVTVVEFYWVMKRSYRRSHDEVLAMLARIVTSEDAAVESAEEVLASIESSRMDGADFSDVLIARSAELRGCSHTVTFDKPAAKRVPGMELLK